MTTTTTTATAILDAITINGDIEDLPIDWEAVEAAYDTLGEGAVHMGDTQAETTKEFWLLGQGLAYEMGNTLYIVGDAIITGDRLLRLAEEEADDYYRLWW